MLREAWANQPSGDEMAHRFNTITRRIMEERGVIGWMIVGAKPWRAVRAAPGLKAGRVERVDLRTGRGLETPVPLVFAYRALIQVHREIGRCSVLRGASISVSQSMRKVVNLRCTERAHDRVVETPGDVEIGNTDGNMIEKLHARPLSNGGSG
jgi:hypothetical protein